MQYCCTSLQKCFVVAQSTTAILELRSARLVVIPVETARRKEHSERSHTISHGPSSAEAKQSSQRILKSGCSADLELWRSTAWHLESLGDEAPNNDRRTMKQWIYLVCDKNVDGAKANESYNCGHTRTWCRTCNAERPNLLGAKGTTQPARRDEILEKRRNAKQKKSCLATAVRHLVYRRKTNCC